MVTLAYVYMLLLGEGRDSVCVRVYVSSQTPHNLDRVKTPSSSMIRI
jgi:hypothetical protein